MEQNKFFLEQKEIEAFLSKEYVSKHQEDFPDAFLEVCVQDASGCRTFNLVDFFEFGEHLDTDVSGLEWFVFIRVARPNRGANGIISTINSFRITNIPDAIGNILVTGTYGKEPLTEGVLRLIDNFANSVKATSILLSRYDVISSALQNKFGYAMSFKHLDKYNAATLFYYHKEINLK